MLYPLFWNNYTILSVRSVRQKFILPVCLPFGEKIKEEMTNAVATIVGWGDTLFGWYTFHNKVVSTQAHTQKIASDNFHHAEHRTPTSVADPPPLLPSRRLPEFGPAAGRRAGVSFLPV